jgi:hypothetical protein
MDPVSLAATLSTALAPFLPYLIKAGEKVAETAGEKFGSGAWERAKALWGKLQPHLEEKPVAMSAAEEVAQAPNDEDAIASLRLQLRKLLQEHPDLIGELQPQAEQLRAHAQMIVSGQRALGIQGGMHGGTAHTGDTFHGTPDRNS